jgi:hypothetical protein
MRTFFESWLLLIVTWTFHIHNVLSCTLTNKITDAILSNVSLFVLTTIRISVQKVTTNIHRRQVSGRFCYVTRITSNNDWQYCVRDRVQVTLWRVELRSRTRWLLADCTGRLEWTNPVELDIISKWRNEPNKITLRCFSHVRKVHVSVSGWGGDTA